MNIQNGRHGIITLILTLSHISVLLMFNHCVLKFQTHIYGYGDITYFLVCYLFTLAYTI